MEWLFICEDLKTLRSAQMALKDERTSYITEASEYTSLEHVGRGISPSAGGSRSSGASHLTVPPALVNVSTEVHRRISTSTTDDNPKSARHGEPVEVIIMLVCPQCSDLSRANN